MKVEGSELAAVIAGADAARAAFRTELHDGGEAGAHGIGDGGLGEPIDHDFKHAIEIVVERGVATCPRKVGQKASLVEACSTL